MKIRDAVLLITCALLAFALTPGVSGTQSSVNQLIEQLGNDDGQVQLDAVKSLEGIGSSAVDPLVTALNGHVNVNVRKNAAITLGRLRATTAVPALLNALRQENGLVRMSAAWALGEIKDIRSIDPLCESLKDSVWSVRMRAAEALGKIGDDRASAALFPLLKDSQEKVREAAKKALADIKGQA
jgi:HEAT repeat protein